MSLWRSGEQRWCCGPWLAEQKVWCSIYGVAATISEICYFLLQSAILLKRRNQPAWRSAEMQFSAACQDYIPLIVTPDRALVFWSSYGTEFFLIIEAWGIQKIIYKNGNMHVFPRVWLTADGHTLPSEWLCHDTLHMNIDECDNTIQKKIFKKGTYRRKCEWV